MKNRIKLIWVVLLVFAQIACKKEANKTITKTDTLSAVTWKYQQFYKDYNQSNTVLIYSIYKSNNLKDLSRNRIKYNSNGTYTETDENGTVTSGSWKFTDNEQTITLQTNQTVIIKRLLVLDKTGFQWGTQDGNTVAVMVPE